MNAYRRDTRRYWAKEDIDLNATFNYMGTPIIASVKDISKKGTALIVEKEPFSIIDFAIIDLNISTKTSNLSLPARILYSEKIGSSGRKRRYGLHFLKHNQDLKNFITQNCTPAQKSCR